MSKPMIDFDDEPEDEFDILFREAIREGMEREDLSPIPDVPPMPYTPTWAKKEEALLKKVFGDDFDYQEWLKINREEGQT